MKLTKAQDYATLIVSYLAKEGKTVSVRKICNDLNLPIPFTRRILNSLSKSKIVEGVEGSDGGYKIFKDPSSISIYDIISSLGGDIKITECIDCNCPLEGRCLSSKVFKNLNGEIVDKFIKIKISDILK
jgi:Rrf2 family protein